MALSKSNGGTTGEILNSQTKVESARKRQAMEPGELWPILARDPQVFTVLDLRPQAAFANGHVPGAICYEAMKKQFLESADQVCGDRIVIYSQSGLQEDYANFQASEGAVICTLSGGWLAWMRDGLPFAPPLSDSLEPGQMFDGMDKRLVNKRAADR